MSKRIFYIEWQHKVDSERMSAILSFDNAEELFDFFSYEEDPLVYFVFHDITDEPIKDFERKINYNDKNSL